MVKRNLNKNQTKLGIKTLDWNVPAQYNPRKISNEETPFQ